ncbi:MAG TPA: Maf family protein, partial [Steroidobacter sp.]|nr:Maf family protein [Steroidobacter sp.]
MQNSANFLIYLASASPRRSALLTQVGVAHRVRPVDVDETLEPGETPVQYVERLAALKAETLWGRLYEGERRPVLGADTTVTIDDRILAKPADEEDAVRMLGLLSGRTHQVCTAVALRHARGCERRLSVSEVSLRALTEKECRTYWRSGEPADKAGGYAVQGLAAVFIQRIAGSYSGIMGLP